MRVAVIDVGSNTARVLVADVSADGGVTAVEERRERLGLGCGDRAQRGTLSRDTVRTVARAAGGTRRLGRALGAERAQAIVTAPGRQGRAPGLLVSALAEATRLPVRVLSADEEGRLAYDGAVARARALAGGRRRPWSTSAAARPRSSSATHGGGATWVGSIDLGSIRLTRQHLHGDPPGKRELRKSTRRRARRDGRALTGAARSRPSRPGAARGRWRSSSAGVHADDVERAIASFARRPSAKVAREAGIHPVRAASVLGGALLLAEAARAARPPARARARRGAERARHSRSRARR